jgi:uncharacterized membrane protein YbhN (UPF0104 family)
MSRWWRWVFGLVLLGAGLRYAARFPWADTRRTLAAADWRWLAAAGGANLLSLACKAGGLHLLLRRLAPGRQRTAQAATFAGAAAGSVSVGMSGEAIRLHLLTAGDGVDTGTAARAIAASRVVEAGALGVYLIGLAAVAAARDGAIGGWRLVAGAAALPVTALAVLRWVRWLGPAAGWTVRGLVGPLALGVMAWTLQWATYHWAIAATGVAVTAAASALALVLANLGGILRLTPGNAGIVQGAVVIGLAPSGVAPAQAVAAGLALQALQVLPVQVIGTAILGRHGLRTALGAAGRNPVPLPGPAPTALLPRESAVRPVPPALGADPEMTHFGVEAHLGGRKVESRSQPGVTLLTERH